MIVAIGNAILRNELLETSVVSMLYRVVYSKETSAEDRVPPALLNLPYRNH